MLSRSHTVSAALILLAISATSSTAQRRSSTPPAQTRTYYVAADEVAWDYVPGGRDEIAGTPYVDSGFFRGGKPRVESTVYRKALYREYTDSSFRTLKPRPPAWAHLGFVGPVLRGVVGDTIRVVFRNNASRAYSVHPHGVFYDKRSEGVPYNDGTSAADKTDDAVPPGGTHVYVWAVPERAGPGPMDGSSIMWMYHSHVDEVRDINTGLMGPMIITARGMARADGSPTDVDRELVIAFEQVHEEDSWLADRNGLRADSLAAWHPIANQNERQNFYPWFVKFSLNGFVHGSMPVQDVTIRRGQRVRWYVMSSTNDFDFHAPHWHGNTVMIARMRTDVAQLLDMGMVIADMVPDDPGIWLFHCHVSFHNSSGMALRYRVE